MTVEHDGAGSLRVRFPFDRALVDLIKSLPERRWNAAERFWSVPEQHVLLLVDLLLPHAFRFDAATLALYRDFGGTADLASAAPPPRRDVLPGLFDEPDDPRAAVAPPGTDYTVSRLNEEVRRAIEEAFPRAVWLVGEVSGFNRNAHKRHVTFQLVEHDAAGRGVSSIGATLFDQARSRIERALEEAGKPFALEDEIAVRVLGRVDLYVPWGSYRIVVEEIDVRYTLGEAARRREEIVRRLTEEGLVGVNSTLPLPIAPLRVGLVTSIASDAYNDVLRTLQESGFAFEITVHGARVQGRQTEPSVLNALETLAAEALDVVLICRGGGSRTDLAWFDSLALGRAVARMPVPVIVGIGHEQDHSVLDAVGRRAKTPTAAAMLVVDQVRAGLERLEGSGRGVLDAAARRIQAEARAGSERGRRLARAARGLLDRERVELAHRRARAARAASALVAACTARVAGWARDIPRAGLLLLGRQRGLLDRARSALGPRASRIVARELERASARERRVRLVHPRRVLERGYAIVRRGDGCVVKRTEMAPAGEPLRAELGNGTLRMRSEGAVTEEGA